MSGSIQHRPDRPKAWKARYRASDGGQRSRSFRRKIDAQSWLAEQQVDYLRGEWTDPRNTRVTFGEWIDQYSETRRHLRPSSRAVVDSLTRTHVLPYFAPRPLAAVTPTDVQGFVSTLEGKGLAPSTIKQAYLVVHGVFASALDSGLIARTPCRGVKLPQVQPGDHRYLMAEEVGELAQAIDDRYRAMVLAAAYTGLRFGELAGLKVSDLDLLKRRLTVRRTLSEVRGVVRLAEPKTAASRRQVALPAFLVDVLAAHLDEHPPSDGLVFTSADGSPLRRTNFRRRAWLPAVAATVGEPMTFHDLRHTHAAWLIAGGEHAKTIQTRLGHGSISTTLDTYGHLMEGLDAAAADRLDSMHAGAGVAQVWPKASGEVVALESRRAENPG